MAGIAAVSGQSIRDVGAGLSQAQFQMEWQVRVMKEQQRATQSIGSAALDLIRSATASVKQGPVRNDLDVKA
jgi:hypothetical protein